MDASSGHDVRKRVETWIAYRNPDGVVAFLLKKLYQYSFAVETSFTPTAKPNSVYFAAQTVKSPRALTALSAFKR